MHDLRSYCTYRDIWYTDGFRFSWRWTKIGTIKQGIEMVKKLAQGILKQLLNNYFYHPQQLKFWQHSQKVIPWDTPESMSYSWLSEALDLSHMVMDIRKQLKITVFIIPINFCFNNIAKKSYHGTPRDHALLLAVRGSEPQADCHRHPETN